MEHKTTTRGERILAAFSHLKSKGLVKTQQDVADMMGANKTTISQAFKGNETYLTDKFHQLGQCVCLGHGERHLY